MKQGTTLMLVVMLLSGCVGYIHLGGRESRPDVYIGMDGAQHPTPAVDQEHSQEPSSKCPPYVFVDGAPLNALPDFDGTEPEHQVIEVLGNALMQTRKQYTDYVRKSNENYQAYLLRCTRRAG
jgi:hypothetical protein